MKVLARIRRFAPSFGVALGLAALLAACSRQPDVALTGTVTDAYTGQPVPAASIALGEQNLTTDSSGAFNITNWSTKETLQVSAQGYEPTTVDLAAQPQLAQPTPPAVSIQTTLRPNTLSGTITDAYTGQPIAGVTIEATTSVTATVTATTDANGSYRLAGLPETFSLTATMADYEAASADLNRTTTADLTLRPNTLRGLVTDSYTKAPIVGATVTAGTTSATTDAEGRYLLSGIDERATIIVAADGYAELSQPIERQLNLDATLRPDTLKLTLVDADTATPISNATIIATPDLVSTDVAYARIDNSADGLVTISGLPEQGYLKILAPGYEKQTIEIKPGSIPATIQMKPFQVKALYVTAAVASRPNLLARYFDMIDRTELNAIVIDLKSDLRDDLGLVYYDSQVPLVKELGLSQPYMDIKAILAEAKQRGIYTIARVHIFSHDNVLADARPEWAARDRKTGGVFADYPTPDIRYAWLDPWNQNVWDYNIQLSVEAALLGFDEINYDYIRFPSLEFAADDKERLQLSREGTAEERFANIAQMLERSQRAINGAGAFLSVDVFGYVAFEPVELIGQSIATMAPHTDYICPMVYPSHFNPGEFGLDNPAAHPYEVISKSVAAGLKQIDDQRARLRPWLQDFTLIWVPDELIVEYGPEEVRAQIKAVEDTGVSVGWILYDSANRYDEAALKPE
ncbi:MAG: putative glycoside hydrolase [Roseiflexaceae bacterium]